MISAGRRRTERPRWRYHIYVTAEISLLLPIPFLPLLTLFAGCIGNIYIGGDKSLLLLSIFLFFFGADWLGGEPVLNNYD